MYMKALYQKIRSLQGKNYGLYKSLADRSWDFGDFVLEFLHVQGDPYAPASRVMIKASLLMLGFPSEWGGTFERRLALSDYLYRRLSALVREKYPDRDAAVVFDTAGPEMLVRNALWVDNGELRACLQVRLPGGNEELFLHHSSLHRELPHHMPRKGMQELHGLHQVKAQQHKEYIFP